jgi:hypothetical protein
MESLREKRARELLVGYIMYPETADARGVSVCRDLFFLFPYEHSP